MSHLDSQLGPRQGDSNFQQFEAESLKKPSGCFLTTSRAFVLVVVVAAALLAVGLGVHFGRPACQTCEVPPTPTPDEQWEQCKRMAEERGECLCNITTSPPSARITGYRLNKTLIPSHYNVELTPDIYLPEPGLQIPGKVEIWMSCNETTDILVLHISRLSIDDQTVEFREDGPGGAVLSHTRWAEDVERQFFKLYLTRNLTVGRTYYFKVSFKASLNHPDLNGFYVSSYEQNNQTKYLALTMFHATYARRAFPCFDEPTFKSTFNITLVRKRGYTSLSNMNLLYTETRPDGYEADVFNQSVPMSTYLVAFVVSDFVHKETTTSNGVLVRHWSRSDYAGQLDFSLSVSGRIQETFEEYTGVPYSLPKIDHIGVPHFRAGAMENWGLVIYRESALLYNANFSTMANKRGVASIVSHELAHQWFGNLVTYDWWNEAFLSEGFATIFAPVGVNGVFPNWKLEEDFMRSFLPVLEYDGFTTSVPIRFDVESHKDAGRTFGTITYRKGASVLRMIEYFLGNDTFRSAINHFLTTHAYQTVTISDLYNSLQQQAVADGKVTWDRSRSISLILQTWLDQQGYPVVDVSHRGGGKYFLSQQHFLYDPENSPRYDSKYGFTWNIPFTHSTESQLQNDNSTLTWIYRGDLEKDTKDPDFILANYRQQGFYRVNYEDQLWNKMVQRLNQDHTFFSEFNRAQLIDDALNLARANKRAEVDAIKTTEFLINETEYLPWYAFNRRMDFYNRMFYNTETYESWQRYLLDRAVMNVYSHVGWDDTDEKEHLEKYLRQLILSIACSRGYEPCVSQARQLYQQFMQNDHINPISPNLRPTVYCEAIKSGGSAEWDFAYKMYEKKYTEYIGNEKSVLRNAMACSRMPWILQRYFNKAVDWRSTSLVQQIAVNPVGSTIVWDFVMSRWNDWPSGLSKSSILRTLTDTYSTKFDLEKFDAFTRMFPDDAMNSTFSSIRATIQVNIRWMETNEVPLRNWLTSVNNNRERSTTDSERRLADISIPISDRDAEFVLI